MKTLFKTLPAQVLAINAITLALFTAFALT